MRARWRRRARRRSALRWLPRSLESRFAVAAGARPNPSRASAPAPRPQRPRLPMALIVHKYGGTSMGSTERIRNVAKRVAKWARAGHQHGGRAVGDERRDQPPARASPRSSSPERDDARADARARHDRLDRRAGLGRPARRSRCRPRASPAVSYAGWQVPIATDSAYTKARIQQHRRRARARRPGRRQGGRHHRLPGHRRATATSRRSAAAAPTPRRWRWPRR